MNQYKLIKKGVFEKDSSFEERMNSMAREGWKALSVAVHSGVMVVLMEKNR